MLRQLPGVATVVGDGLLGKIESECAIMGWLGSPEETREGCSICRSIRRKLKGQDGFGITGWRV